MRAFLVGLGVTIGVVLAAAYTAVSLAPEVFTSPGSVVIISGSTKDEKHRATPAQVEAGIQRSGTSAPDFTAPASDGATYRLDEIVRGGPAVLVFIKTDCPCSRSADPFFQRVQAAGRGWVRFFGIIDGDVAAARKWVHETGAVFPILADPERRIVEAYHVENSAYVAFIRPGGRINKLWAGYSEPMLRELAGLMAPWVKPGLDPLDVADAPSDLYTGCPYRTD